MKSAHVHHFKLIIYRIFAGFIQKYFSAVLTQQLNTKNSSFYNGREHIKFQMFSQTIGGIKFMKIENKDDEPTKKHEDGTITNGFA